MHISDTARHAVRLGFNPSGDSTVLAIKTRTAELITLLEQIRDGNPVAAREAAVAITNVQTASMWSVLAATAHLADKTAPTKELVAEVSAVLDLASDKPLGAACDLSGEGTCEACQ